MPDILFEWFSKVVRFIFAARVIFKFVCMLFTFTECGKKELPVVLVKGDRPMIEMYK